MNQNIMVQGMHGMGDTIHERAIVKQHIERGDNVFIETSWPQIFHDLDVKCVTKATDLRTQAKNAKRAPGYYAGRILTIDQYIRIHYDGREGSVLASMMKNAGTDPTRADFSMPVPKTWQHGIKTDKPILIYRPLIQRTEWAGNVNRNPDLDAYWILFNHLRKQRDYYVVSIADLVPDVEWMVSHPVDADLELHKGELTFEQLASLFSEAELVYTAAGFPVILAKAVGTPVVTVFGGYEDSRSFELGDSPWLPIDVIKPCRCFSVRHKCVKDIELYPAMERIEEFAHASIKEAKSRPASEAPDTGAAV